MKKLRTLFAAATILVATSAFATPGPDKVSERVKNEFEKSFTGASNIKWEVKQDFYFATFDLNAKEVSAAYDMGGELLGVSRILKTGELPFGISFATAERYAGYNVAKTVTEITYEGQTCYYVNVENDKKFLKLKCTGNGEIAVDKKVKKYR
jgi:hypothetical protein